MSQDPRKLCYLEQQDPGPRVPREGSFLEAEERAEQLSSLRGQLALVAPEAGGGACPAPGCSTIPRTQARHHRGWAGELDCYRVGENETDLGFSYQLWALPKDELPGKREGLAACRRSRARDVGQGRAPGWDGAWGTYNRSLAA